MGISEGCFIFDLASLPFEAHLAYHVHKSGHKNINYHHRLICIEDCANFLSTLSSPLLVFLSDCPSVCHMTAPEPAFDQWFDGGCSFAIQRA